MSVTSIRLPAQAGVVIRKKCPAGDAGLTLGEEKEMSAPPWMKRITRRLPVLLPPPPAGRARGKSEKWSRLEVHLLRERAKLLSGVGKTLRGLSGLLLADVLFENLLGHAQLTPDDFKPKVAVGHAAACLSARGPNTSGLRTCTDTRPPLNLSMSRHLSAGTRTRPCFQNEMVLLLTPRSAASFDPP